MLFSVVLGEQTIVQWGGVVLCSVVLGEQAIVQWGGSNLCLWSS